MFYTLDCQVEWERRKKEIVFAENQNLAKRVVEQQCLKTPPFVETILVKFGRALELWGRRLQNRFAADNGQLSFQNYVVKGGIGRKLGT
ncbi:MAG: hypothetical protein JXA42_11415 [Anaerolineales bacterium]|nr:hypothetical protein [Anaerolineales bacterium]